MIRIQNNKGLECFMLEPNDTGDSEELALLKLHTVPGVKRVSSSFGPLVVEIERRGRGQLQLEQQIEKALA